jgi:hypothetical protein
VVTLVVAGVVVGGVFVAVSQFSGHRHRHIMQTSADSKSAARPWIARPYIGPGCGIEPRSSAVPVTGGDGWTDVGGGPAECGGRALVSATTPNAAKDTYTWTFQTARSARCKALVFVSAKDPSPGIAHYQVSGASQRLADFTIDQKAFTGRWVATAVFTTFDGQLKITLSDQANAREGQHHVQASALTIECVS